MLEKIEIIRDISMYVFSFVKRHNGLRIFIVPEEGWLLTGSSIMKIGEKRGALR